MTHIQQNAENAELKRHIWKIANEVRGTVDGWDFKHYVLGALFYRFMSENFADYMDGGDKSGGYAKLSDSEVPYAAREAAIMEKGYFIAPSQLFANVVAKANGNEKLNNELREIFKKIEDSAMNSASEDDFRGLFDDFDTTSNRLGNTVKDKNSRLTAVLKGIAELDFGKFEDNEIDLFGDAYEFLISKYAANAGKSGGEFFTPQQVSKLIAKIAMAGQGTVNKVYDPTCGSGSLLLQAKKHMDGRQIDQGFFGQEANHTTYNLARMNMFLHNVNYNQFNIQLGDTLRDPHFPDEKFDAIVSITPYSVKWVGSDDPTLINDERFAPASVLAPKTAADFAFVLHALHHLSEKGRAAIVCFPGILYRVGAEQKIRKYLVDGNYVESVISLPPNLFYGTQIGVNILVLNKHKPDTRVQFIDASGEDFFKKETNNNVLTDAHIEEIMQLFERKEDVKHVAKSVGRETIAENNYSLVVSSYVEPKDTREVINIKELNAEITATVGKIDNMRSEIDGIVAEIGGGNNTIEKLLDGAEMEYKMLGDENFFEIANRGRLVKASLRVPGDYPYHGANNIIDYVEGYTHDGEFVLIAAVGAASLNPYSTQYATGKFWVSGDAHVIAGKSNVDTRYLYYALSTVNFIPFISGCGRAMLTKGKLINIPIPIPCPDDPTKSLTIQKEIVRILDTFDALAQSGKEGLPREMELRQKQYNYHRDLLFSFQKPEEQKDHI